VRRVKGEGQHAGRVGLIARRAGGWRSASGSSCCPAALHAPCRSSPPAHLVQPVGGHQPAVAHQRQERPRRSLQQAAAPAATATAAGVALFLFPLLLLLLLLGTCGHMALFSALLSTLLSPLLSALLSAHLSALVGALLAGRLPSCNPNRCQQQGWRLPGRGPLPTPQARRARCALLAQRLQVLGLQQAQHALNLVVKGRKRGSSVDLAPSS
jgi:hypothetical protein